MTLQLNSSAFAEGSAIPRKYTGDGDNLSPPLRWSGAPRATRSFAVLCQDPDAPSGTFMHWAVANIAPDQTEMPEGAGKRPRAGFSFARNDFGHASYDGPAPPRGHGVHHYHFVVAALDVDRVDVSPTQTANDLWRKVKPHIIDQAETIGTYQR